MSTSRFFILNITHYIKLSLHYKALFSYGHGKHFRASGDRTENYKTNVKHLVNDGLIKLTNTESLTDPNQSYFTSEEGKIQLIIM